MKNIKIDGTMQQSHSYVRSSCNNITMMADAESKFKYSEVHTYITSGYKKDKQAKVLMVTVCMLDDRDLWYIHACILN